MTTTTRLARELVSRPSFVRAWIEREESVAREDGENTFDSLSIERVEELISHSPSLFLERYGRSLTPTELQPFLMHSQEEIRKLAGFLADRLTPLGQAREQQIIRNRRYRALLKLIEEGEYFSYESMQRREPLLYNEYIGKYSKKKGVDFYDAPTRFSEKLLNSMDHEEIASRWLEEEHKEYLQSKPDCDGNEADDEFKEEFDSDDEQTSISSRSDVSRTKNSNRGIESDVVQGLNSNQNFSSPFQDPDFILSIMQRQNADISLDQECEEEGPGEEEMIELENAFRKLMYDRFLDGMDASYYDYSKVDLSEEFDDLQAVSQDAEDAYFADEEDLRGNDVRNRSSVFDRLRERYEERSSMSETYPSFRAASTAIDTSCSLHQEPDLEDWERFGFQDFEAMQNLEYSDDQKSMQDCENQVRIREAAEADQRQIEHEHQSSRVENEPMRRAVLSTFVR